MTCDSISCALPQAQWTLEFSARALETLQKHVQRGRWSKESVGQLYSSDLRGDRLVVDVVTALKPSWAAWAKVRFDTEQAVAERQAMFEQGLHCIGLWHTHPEPSPTPSPEDRALARDHALAAQPQLNGLVFAIVGTLPMPSGLHVWVDDGQDLYATIVMNGVCVQIEQGKTHTRKRTTSGKET